MTIRSKAVTIIRSGDHYLFTECTDHTNGTTWYIPVGGGIEFGEYSTDAAKREVKEEIGLEIHDLQLIDVSENIFTFNGVREHEIVFSFFTSISPEADLQGLQAVANDNGRPLVLKWFTLPELLEQQGTIYPFNLTRVLTGRQESF